MKEGVLTFESLKPLGSNSSEAIERQLTRDFYEHAVLFSIDCEDGNMFTRYVASLQPFYRVNRFVVVVNDCYSCHFRYIQMTDLIFFYLLLLLYTIC